MTYHRSSWIRAACAGTALAALTTGCGWGQLQADQGVPESSEIAIAGQQLAAVTGVTLWSMPINVCFIDSTGTSGNEYTNLKTAAMSTLWDTWARVPGLSFVDQGDCVGAAPTSLAIELYVGGGGVCGFGQGAHCSVGGDPNAPYIGALVHEVGHALGADHEHQRTDIGTNCMTNAADACLRCKAASDAGGWCAANDWNTCTGDTITSPIRFSTSSAEYSRIGGIIWNIAPWESDKQTIYDPLSVMSYCAVQNGRDPSDHRTTALDLLGMEMLYPTSGTYSIGCANGCFHSDTGAIVRSDGALTTDWTERGGLNVWIRNPYYSQAGNTQLPATSVSAGSSTVSFSFEVPKSTALLTTSGTVNKSDSYHTAIVVSLM